MLVSIDVVTKISKAVIAVLSASTAGQRWVNTMENDPLAFVYVSKLLITVVAAIH